MITSTKKKPQYNATRILAIAPSQYGKSSLINEWALRKIKEKVFHPSRIVLISPTHRSDPVLADLIAICKKKVPTWLEDNAFEHLDSRAEEALLMIYESQKAIKIAIAEGLTNVTLHHYLVLCDDVIGESMMKQRKNNPLDLIATTGRHQNISTVVSLQAYRSTMSSVMRSQFSQIWIGRLLSVHEVTDILSCYSQGLGSTAKEADRRMMELWETAIQKRNAHGFLVIDCYTQYGQGRIRLGSPFDSPVDH